MNEEAPDVGSLHEGVRVGHVHLKVADLERSLAFYCDVLGFRITQRYGSSAVFLAAGDYHHHIGLNTWESLGGSPPPPGSTGLYHFAILYPTRASLADAVRRVVAAGWALEGASSHGVSEAVYIKDPDHNWVELYWDKPYDQWPATPDGKLQMFSEPLDLADLLATAPDPDHAEEQNRSRARFFALSRWENEGGALAETPQGKNNPERLQAIVSRHDGMNARPRLGVSGEK